ncbi:hypothetical protein P7C70_g4926, partial [Phenoliferia sp. Uapishka_3]
MWILAVAFTHACSSLSRSTNSHVDKALVENGYDAIAPKYLAWSGPRRTETRTKYIDLLAETMPRGASLLELGCGAGVPATQQLIAHGFQVTGTDISQIQIELAREHCPGGTFRRGDMMELDFPPESYDVICAFYSIFHLPVEEQGQLVGKMMGWVKKGGKLLFNLRSDEGEHRWDDWMGVKMFSCSVGVEGNRNMMKNFGDQAKVEEELAIEKVGGFEETFHWFLVSKGC